MALTRLKSTGVSSTSTFTFANITATGNITSSNIAATNISATSLTGTFSSESNAQPNITSLGSLTSLTVNGLSTTQQSTEVFVPIASASGTTLHDFSAGAVFYHTDFGQFAANFKTIPNTDNRTTTVKLILNQGSTAYLPTVQINDVTQTVVWPNATSPTPVANRKEVVTYTFYRVSGSWVVYGELKSFG